MTLFTEQSQLTVLVATRHANTLNYCLNKRAPFKQSLLVLPGAVLVDNTVHSRVVLISVSTRVSSSCDFALESFTLDGWGTPLVPSRKAIRIIRLNIFQDISGELEADFQANSERTQGH